MEVGKHPTIDVLKTQSDQDWVKAHVASCERCADILAGLQLIQSEAEARHEPVDSLLLRSREETWEKISPRMAKRKVEINRWASAAVLVVGLCFSLWYFYPVDETDVFGQIDVPYPTPSTFRSTEVDKETPFTTYYDLGEFEKARTVLNRMEQNGEVLFYLGQTYLYQQKPRFDSAHFYFSSVQVSKSLYVDVAGFYTVLTHLKNQDTISARKKLINILESPGHSRKENAKQLFELIE